jgi:ABC-type Fe3+ transport system permease subunit
MSEKELGRALLELDAHRLAGVGNVQEQTWKILERDRNRVWWWTAITFGLWGLAICMVLLMMVLYALVFPLQAKLRQDQELARIGVTTPEQREAAQFKGQIMFQMVTLGVTMSVGVTCLAVLASVLLNRASRRATLRQINASLMEISQQLKELKESSGPPSTAA